MDRRSTRTHGARLAVALTAAIAANLDCGSCHSRASPEDAGTSQLDGGADAAPSADAGSDSGSTTDPFSLFCYSYVRAFCGWLVVCNQFFDDSANDCAALYSRSWCDTWGQSLAKGYLVYDAAAAAACLTALQSSPRCDPAAAESCSLVMRANSSAGAPCFTSLDCIDPRTTCAGTACQSTCQPAGASGIGSACVTAGDCPAGLRCDAVFHVCTVPVTNVAGEPCTGDAVICVGQTRCEGAVLPSDGGPGRAGLCAATHLGDGCTDSTQCPTSAVCVLDDGGVSGSCILALATSPCVNDLNCPAGEYCLSGTCETTLPAGSPCTGSSWEECVSPLACRVIPDAGLVCATSVEIGVPCVDDQSCVAPLVCAAGLCSWAGESGQYCSHGSPPCFAGACDTDSGVCGPPLPNGQTCSSVVECASGNCIEGSCANACP